MGQLGETMGREAEKEEMEASVNVWKYVFGFTEMAVVKCAIELGIADALEKNGGSMLLSELSTCVECPPTSLSRIMRFLVHLKIFNQTQTNQVVVYSQTALSRLLMRGGKKSMASFILLESTLVMLAPWLGLSDRAREKSEQSAFEAANHGLDVWGYAANNPSHSKLINDAMACDARLVVPHIINSCPHLFKGVTSLVDVGGGDGTALSMLVEAFVWLRGINFDLPHVVSNNTLSRCDDRLHHVGGNMFDDIPNADIVFLMWVLHDWGDDECIKILKKCKEAIPKDKGKVIIVEAIVKEGTIEDDDYSYKMQDVRLMLDMVMMAHTTHGKERTLKEWSHLLKESGFTNFDVNPIQAVQSVIVAYP